jgi:hypothetical protein
MINVPDMVRAGQGDKVWMSARRELVLRSTPPVTTAVPSSRTLVTGGIELNTAEKSAMLEMGVVVVMKE